MQVNKIFSSYFLFTILYVDGIGWKVQAGLCEDHFLRDRKTLMHRNMPHDVENKKEMALTEICRKCYLGKRAKTFLCPEQPDDI